MPDHVHTVTEISRNIRFALEGKFRNIWIVGEVSNLSVPRSGHSYFTLKDADAQISCVMFRNTILRFPIDLRDGLKVFVQGDIKVYEQRGQYQLVVQFAQSAGAGELQARFEELKKRLLAEGLFDLTKKKPIPPFPSVIAVVTSPSGAAIQDILKVLSRRAPWVHLLIAPVKVQGEGSSGEIARAIRYLATLPPELPAIDTLIVARGGGSIEDLWAFNEEEVARAIHDCPIPVISGVGHEIDFTIADFVADRREPTPSAAVEAAVPDGVALRHRLGVLQSRLDRGMERHFRHWRQALLAYRREIEAREPGRKLQSWAQSLDFLEARFESALKRKLESYQMKLDRLEAVFSRWNPDRDLLLARERAQRASNALDQVLDRQMAVRRELVAQFEKLLQAIGPQKTLRRGFSMTLDENGAPVFDAAVLKPGQIITTRFAKGNARSEVKEVQ